MPDDNSLDIYLRIITERTGEKPEEVLKKIKQQVTETGKEGVKQEEAVTEATDKTTASKKQLRDMTKQLGREFPLLGQIARLALNPVALVSASIVGSFALWRTRMKEMAQSFGGVEMGGVTEDAVARIERLGIALAKMKEANAGQGVFGKMKSDLESSITLIKDNDALFQAMGINTGTGALEAEAVAKGSAAAKLEAEANARIKAAGTPGSVEEEAALRKQFKEAAEKAAVDKAQATKRRDDISDYENAPAWMKPILKPRMVTRYGMSFGGGEMTTSNAKALEEGNIASQQGIIDRYGRFTDAAAGRAGRRKAIGEGEAALGEVGKLDNEVVSLLRQIAAGIAGSKLPGSPNPGGNVTDPAAIQQQIQYFNKQPELMAAVERAIIAAERLAQRVTNLERR